MSAPWSAPSGQWNQSMPPDMNMGSYTPEQWAAMQNMQQQNWVQWSQWQQQYSQWQNHYGDKYYNQMQVMPGMPPLPMGGAAPPPAPPPPDKPPPPPPPHENNQPLFGNKQPNSQVTAIPQVIPPKPQNNVPTNSNNYPIPSQAVNVEALSKLAEEERLFDIQFKKWEEEIEKWRKENENHPDTQAYKDYEEKFEACRAQLLERRKQMKIRRDKLMENSNRPTNVAPTANLSNNQYINPATQNYPNQRTQPPPKNFSYDQNQFGKTNIDPQDRYESYDDMEMSKDSSASGKVDNSDFLQGNASSKGIPGLDLVPEDKSQRQEVIELNDDQSDYRGPDYTSISQGINTILEDEKIMNILSMVKHQTNANAGNQPGNQQIQGNNNRGDNTGHQNQQWNRNNNFQQFGNRQDSNGPIHQNDFQQNQFMNRNQQNHSYGNQNMAQRNDQYSGPNNNMPPRNNQYSGPQNNIPPNNMPHSNMPPRNEQYRGPNNMLSRNDQYAGPNNNMPLRNNQYGGPNNNMPPNNEQYRGPNNMPPRHDQFEGNSNMPPRNNQFEGNSNMPPRNNQFGGQGNVPPRNNNFGNSQIFSQNNNGGPSNMQQQRNFPPNNQNNFGRPNIPSLFDVPLENPAKFSDNQSFENKPPNNQPPEPKWTEPLFTPSIIVEYEHVSLRLKARDFIEPVHTFHYNHVSKDEEFKKKDFNAEAEDLFVRKRRRSEMEDERGRPELSHKDAYSRDAYTRERDPHGKELYSREPPSRIARDSRDLYSRDPPYARDRDLYPRDRDPIARDREPYARESRDHYGRSERSDREIFDRDRDRRPRDEEEFRSRIAIRRDDDRYIDDRRVSRRDDLRDRDRDRERVRDKRDERIRSRSKDRDSRRHGVSKERQVDTATSNLKPDSETVKHTVMIDDLLEPPGRDMRPEKIVIILRGLPGSGKSYLAKLIRDREAEHGGTVRIMSIDDYFMLECEVEEVDATTGKMVKKPTMKYEFDDSLEAGYINSLKRAFKRSLTDGYFTFLIYDAVNDQLKHYADIWNFARQCGFQVYVCTMDVDVQTCHKRNIHNRKIEDIEVIRSRFFTTPQHHLQLDPTNILQNAAIQDVQMEDAIDEVVMEDAQDEVENSFTSKWERMDDVNQLARLDGTSKPLRSSQLSIEDYLQLDEWKPNTAKPGKKTVRWADIEERREQEKMRAIGFVVGQTDWNRMTDPTMGSSALTQTKYIERVRRN